VNFQSILTAEFAPHGALSDLQLSHLAKHYSLMMRWNRRLNLTRIESVEDAVKLHYCESLFLGTLLPAGPLQVGDVGSGAGFPGIPIAILRPDCQLFLIESHQRKAVFLREAVRDLANVKVVSSRVEELSMSMDWVVSRSVVPIQVLSLTLAPNAALLTSAAALLRTPMPYLVIPSPWGRDRIVAMFHVKHDKIDNRGKGHRNHESEGGRGEDNECHQSRGLPGRK